MMFAEVQAVATRAITADSFILVVSEEEHGSRLGEVVVVRFVVRAKSDVGF